ncbi:MAG: LlaJI family restriction endonuclease [Bacillota bacterium]|nr:LlaJI family restriction endonuclease [Bacillota bacterium]
MTNDYRIVFVENSNEPMGIEFLEDVLTFKVPKTFRIEENEKINRRNLLLFVKSLNLSDTAQRSEIWKSGEKGNSWPIDSYIWIIRDFLENGYYYNREKKYSNTAKGKIDWKKTMKQMPIISNCNVIYDKLITSVSSPSNDLIAQIYKLCLKIAQSRIGWVFGYNLFIEVNINNSLAEMKRTVSNESNLTFDDVKRLRFKHMLNILNSISEKNLSNSQFSYLINNYYYVFETMVDKLLGGVSEKEWEKYNPKGSWSLLGYKKKFVKPLETDTILKELGNTYIIDAKMYKYGFTGEIRDLPGSDSIQKQITYGDHAKNKLDNKVRNAFIVPFDKKNHKLDKINYEKTSNDNMIFVGYAKGDWREQGNDHDKIYTYLIDFNYVLENYHTKDVTMVRNLCDDIEKHISLIK